MFAKQIPFVGRTQTLADVCAHLHGDSHGGPSLIALHGMPGIGKSRFLEELQSALQGGSQRVLVAKLHCGSDRSRQAPWALLDLQQQLRKAGRGERRLRFSAFDIAFEAWVQKTHPEVANDFAKKDLFDNLEDNAATAADVAVELWKDVPGGGAALKAANWARHAYRRRLAVQDCEGELSLEALSQADSVKLEQVLAKCFCLDLQRYLKHPESKKIALLLDSADWVFAEDGALPFGANVFGANWVQALATGCRRVTFVTSSLERPACDWMTSIFGQIIPISLAALTRADIQECGRLSGLSEDECSAISAQCTGLPLHMALMLERTDYSSVPAGSHRQLAPTLADLLPWFLSRYPEQLRVGLRALSFLQAFDVDLFRSVMHSFGVPSWSESLPNLQSSTLFESIDDRLFALHSAIAEDLRQSTDEKHPELRTAVYDVAFKFYDEALATRQHANAPLTETDPFNFLNAWRYLYAYSPSLAVKWLPLRFVWFRNRKCTPMLLEPLAAAYKHMCDAGEPADSAYRIYVGQVFTEALIQVGQYRAALEILQNEIGSPQIILGRPRAWIKQKLSCSDCYLGLDQLDEARSAAEDACEAARRNPDDPEALAHSLAQLGLVCGRQNEPIQAVRVLDEALDVARRNGVYDLSELNQLWERRAQAAARLASIMGDIEGLKRSYEDFSDLHRSLVEEYGSDHWAVARSHNNLAMTASYLGKHKIAEQHCLDGLQVLASTPFAPPLVKRFLRMNLGATYQDLGDFPKARQVYEEVEAEWDEYGSRQSREYGLLVDNKAMLMLASGEGLEALKMNEKALEILEKTVESTDIAIKVALTNRLTICEGVGLPELAAETDRRLRLLLTVPVR